MLNSKTYEDILCQFNKFCLVFIIFNAEIFFLRIYPKNIFLKRHEAMNSKIVIFSISNN